MTQGSDATGDIYYRAADGTLTRLATGAADTVLTSGGTGVIPTFAAAGGGMSVVSHQELAVTLLHDASTTSGTVFTTTFNATSTNDFYYLIANFNVQSGDTNSSQSKFRLIDVTNSNTELAIAKIYLDINPASGVPYCTSTLMLHHRFQPASVNSTYTVKLTVTRLTGRVITYGVDEDGGTSVTLFKE
jgi:hypothetical protein